MNIVVHTLTNKRMPRNATTSEAEAKHSPYEMVGGESGVRRIVDRFYDIMNDVPEAARIRAMHATDLSPMRERLFEFLSGWLGGPPLYFQRPDHKCIVSAHRCFAIGEAERDEWMMCMRRALEDCHAPKDVRELLDQPFLRMAEAFRNR
jgi:hemoglobin